MGGQYNRVFYKTPHLSLRRMILRFDDFTRPLLGHGIDLFLSCVPKLEQLTVHGTMIG
jgi:hypothetical protein